MDQLYELFLHFHLLEKEQDKCLCHQHIFANYDYKEGAQFEQATKDNYFSQDEH